MKILTQSERCLVSGRGVLVGEGYGISVTGNSSAHFNGKVFTSQGIIYNPFTDDIYADFTKDDSPCCIGGKLYTAVPIEDGYMYSTSTC